MTSESYHKMYAFEYNEEEDTLTCYVYVMFRGEDSRAGWYKKEFNKPEDIQNRSTAQTSEEMQNEMRKQSTKYGICDIVERFRNKLQPLNWERVSGPPNFGGSTMKRKTKKGKTPKKKPGY